MKTRVRIVQGFTLIELAVVIAVAGVVLTLAAPNFRDLVLGNRRTVATNELVRALHVARDSALTRGLPVTVKSTNPADAGDEWGPGWMVFVDDDADGVLDAAEEVLMQDFVVPDGVTLDDVDDLSFVQYRPAGNISTSPTIRQFNVCSSEQSEVGRQITISPIGRISSTPTTCL